MKNENIDMSIVQEPKEEDNSPVVEPDMTDKKKSDKRTVLTVSLGEMLAKKKAK